MARPATSSVRRPSGDDWVGAMHGLGVGLSLADFDVVEFLQALTEGTVELGLAAESGILLADPNGELQVMAASRERTRVLELFQLQSREGPCLDAWRTGRPVTVPDLAREQQRWPTFAPEALAVGFRTVHATRAAELRRGDHDA